MIVCAADEYAFTSAPPSASMSDSLRVFHKIVRVKRLIVWINANITYHRKKLSKRHFRTLVGQIRWMLHSFATTWRTQTLSVFMSNMPMNPRCSIATSRIAASQRRPWSDSHNIFLVVSRTGSRRLMVHGISHKENFSWTGSKRAALLHRRRKQPLGNRQEYVDIAQSCIGRALPVSANILSIEIMVVLFSGYVSVRYRSLFTSAARLKMRRNVLQHRASRFRQALRLQRDFNSLKRAVKSY
jgi:hypothetical protein